MSVARRIAAGLLCAAALAGPLAGAGEAWAATAEQRRLFDGVSATVASDPVSGFAIFGYDPVAYFVDEAPRPGRAEYEWRSGAAVWRFASEGNLAAFRAHPEVYAPAYGGYDAEAIARGVAVAPDPTVFAVVGSRLFLFRSADARSRFLRENAEAAADAAWPALAAQLGR